MIITTGSCTLPRAHDRTPMTGTTRPSVHPPDAAEADQGLGRTSGTSHSTALFTGEDTEITWPDQDSPGPGGT